MQKRYKKILVIFIFEDTYSYESPFVNIDIIQVLQFERKIYRVVISDNETATSTTQIYSSYGS